MWSNEWCTTQKAAGKCIDNYVLTKCLGTCGSCCIDEGDEKDVRAGGREHLAPSRPSANRWSGIPRSCVCVRPDLQIRCTEYSTQYTAFDSALRVRTEVDYCETVHESGQCFAKSSKCMKTCGVCELDAKLDCPSSSRNPRPFRHP